MIDNPKFTIRPAFWEVDTAELKSVRERVFIEEQHVLPELEWDEQDPQCFHVLATNARGSAIGTGRLTADGHIGRMAVLKEWRGYGVGKAILDALVDAAKKRGFGIVALAAQTHAVPFYEAQGFVAEGPEFEDAGIPHRRMTRPLDR